MKAKVFLTTALTIVLFGLNNYSDAQVCGKKEYNDLDFGDYDYQGQSSFAKLSPGDTSRVKIVVYSNQMYRIFVDFDPKLGEVKYKIINPVRKSKKVIQSIQVDTNRTYLMKDTNYVDRKGNIVEDPKDYVVTGQKIKRDTTYSSVRYTDEIVIFDNKSNKTGKDYFETSFKKSDRIFIDITLPPGNPGISGCVNVYVGNKILGSKSFEKQGKTRLTEN
jgi:hypothetical protein